MTLFGFHIPFTKPAEKVYKGVVTLRFLSDPEPAIYHVSDTSRDAVLQCGVYAAKCVGSFTYDGRYIISADFKWKNDV